MGATREEARQDRVTESLTEALSLLGRARSRLTEAEIYWTDATQRVDELFMSVDHSLDFAEGDAKMLQSLDLEDRNATED